MLFFKVQQIHRLNNSSPFLCADGFQCIPRNNFQKQFVLFAQELFTKKIRSNSSFF